MVGAGRFELPTPGPPDRCANRAALRSEASMQGRLHITLGLAKQAPRALLILGRDKNPAADLDLVDQSTERTHIDLWQGPLAIA